MTANLNYGKNIPDIEVTDGIFAGLNIGNFINIPDTIADDYKEEIDNVSEKTGMDEMPVEIFESMLMNIYNSDTANSKKYRDIMLLVLHANFGMRYSDVSNLKIYQLIDENGSFREKFSLVEKKTKNTRKTKKVRTFYINASVKLAVSLYLSNISIRKNYYDYLITSESNNKKKEIAPDGTEITASISHQAESDIIKKHIESLNTELRLNTHSLRKMYARAFRDTAIQLKAEGKIMLDNDIDALIQYDYGHSTRKITDMYNKSCEQNKAIVCMNMNIGYSILRQIIENRKEF